MDIMNPELLNQAEREAMDMTEYIPPEAIAKPTKKIGKNEIGKATETLQTYKSGKTSLENRILEEDKFWRLRHWEDQGESGNMPSSSAYLWNSVVNKHADMMDNYPEAAMLPREQSDERSAEILSKVIPVVLSRNRFEKTYSDAAWYKVKHGTSVTGVFWNPQKDNGLGDIDIKQLDILNVFWEPGITDIQDSKNLFIVELADNETLEQMYPECHDHLGQSGITVAEYVKDDTVDTSDKSLVIDWYYKKRLPTGQIQLHYAKYVNDVLLYSSENEGQPFYEHGMYPVVLDVMYPEAGTCYGYGTIAVAKYPQMFIDAMDDKILKYAKRVTNPRYWMKTSAGVNEEEFLDETKPIVHCTTDINEEKLKQMEVDRLDSMVYNVRQMKVDELKETSNNRDVNSGSTSSGVTSGAAIAVLQEAGNKTVRDIIQTSYRNYEQVVILTLEVLRQFYDETRTFRIVSENSTEYVEFNNSAIKEQPMMSSTGKPIVDEMGEQLYRKPIFDIEVKAQKRNPYSRLSQNETAANLYSMGIFNPENAQMALAMLELMDFEGKEKVVRYVSEGATLHNVIQQQMQTIAQLQQMLGMAQQMSAEGMPQAQGPKRGMSGRNPIDTAQQNGGKAALNDYGKNLVGKSRASAEKGIEGGHFA